MAQAVLAGLSALTSLSLISFLRINFSPIILAKVWGLTLIAHWWGLSRMPLPEPITVTLIDLGIVPTSQVVQLTPPEPWEWEREAWFSKEKPRYPQAKKWWNVCWAGRTSGVHYIHHHLFIQQTFEPLLYARPCATHWGHNKGHDRPSPWLQGVCGLGRTADFKPESTNRRMLLGASVEAWGQMGDDPSEACVGAWEMASEWMDKRRYSDRVGTSRVQGTVRDLAWVLGPYQVHLH